MICLEALYAAGYHEEDELVPFGLDRRLGGEVPEEAVVLTEADEQHLRSKMMRLVK